MPLTNLDHYLLLTQDLEATQDFYVDVLGLTAGPRPPFPFPGAWFYLGDRAVVHVAERGADTAGGPIDHIAFAATGLAEMLARAEARGLAAQHRKVPDLGLHQLFLHDPNGVKIELNYSAEEGAAFDRARASK